MRSPYKSFWSPDKKPSKAWKNRKFFLSRSVENWMEILPKDKELRTVGIPAILEKWRSHSIITGQQEASLVQLLSSPDEENWAVALTIMRTIGKKRKRDL